MVLNHFDKVNFGGDIVEPLFVCDLIVEFVITGLYRDITLVLDFVNKIAGNRCLIESPLVFCCIRIENRQERILLADQCDEVRVRQAVEI